MKKLLVVLVIIIASCNKNKLALDYLDDSQKNILKEILKENDSLLGNEYGLTVESNYNKHLNELSNSENISYALPKSLFIQDQKICNIFLKNDIFIEEDVIKFYDHKKIKVKRYNLNFKSSYMKFLENISRHNDVIDEYNNALKLSGSLSPSSTSILLKKLTKKDLLDDNVRLIVGVHFLLLNNS